MLNRAVALMMISMLGTYIAGAQPARDSVLQQIASLEREYGGRAGVMAKNLATGEVIAYNASERFPTASAIKLPVMVAFYQLAARNEVDSAIRIELHADDIKPGSGVLQFLSDGAVITLLDAVRLMIVQSDNTATNLVLDHLAPTHEARLSAVNDAMVGAGLKNTRLLNRLYSWKTKQLTPEGIRYGIGVSTAEDMVTLLEGIYRRTVADSASCASMIGILKQQAFNEMIPRYLPDTEVARLEVAHKTGGINETKVDVGLILSDRADIALAIFVDKHPDHREADNRATELGARIARVLWNHYTGMSGFGRAAAPRDADWNPIPGGSWCIFRSAAAPFPHPARAQGYPAYSDSSIVVFVPEGFRETSEGTNLIVHFHGHLNDNLGVLERYRMPQAMIARKVNALLVIPQGPFRVRDSFGGKMEDSGGFKALVNDVLAMMKKEKIVSTSRVGRVIISAHSGGYRPAAFAADRGGLQDRIAGLFLFDALYGQHDLFKHWLDNGSGTIRAAYTEHLAKEHQDFARSLDNRSRDRFVGMSTTVEHDEVVQTFFEQWLALLDDDWFSGVPAR